MKKILFSILLLSFSSVNAEDLIIFPENNTQSSQLNDVLAGTNKDQVDVTHNLSSIRVSEFNVDSGVEKLDGKNIFHDITKTQSSKWYRYYFNTEIGVPFSFTFPNLLGPVGINFGFKPGMKGEFSIISKSQDPKIDAAGKMEQFKLGAVNGLKAISIPQDVDKLLKEYPTGSEINFNGYGYLTAYTGINIGVPGISANANITAVVEGNLIKNIKILENSKEKLIELRYERSNKKGKGTTFDMGVGITLFETTIPIGSSNTNFTGALRVNFISKSYLKTTKKTFIYDFVYDLRYTGTKEALEEALKGNLIPSQELAKTRFELKPYKGVILKEKRTDLILNSISDSKYGFRINDSSLDSGLSDVYARESLGGFFEIGKQRQSEQMNSERTLFYREKSTQKVFTHSAKDSTKFLFGLINNNKNLNIVSKVIDAEVVSEGQGIGKVKTYKMTFNYENNHKNGGKKALNNFLYKASQSLGWNNHPTKHVITDIAEKRYCTNDAKIKVNATIYQEAFKKMLSYRPAETWSYFGKYLGYKIPAKFRYDKTRKKLFSKMQIEYRKARSDKSIREKPVLSWKFRLFQKFKSYAFPEKLAELSKIVNKEKQLESLHKLVSKFEMTDDLLHFLLILGQGDLKDKNSARGVISKFSIKSSGCDLNWRLDHKPKFKADDLFSDWI